MCTCGHGCPDRPVSKSSVGNGWPLRHRFAYAPDGTGRHGDPRSELFAGSFYERTCQPVFREMDGYARFAGISGLAWVGNVGVTVCKAGMHGLGRAFDLTRVQMHGWHVDCNTSWRADRGLAERRGYLAVVATCRRHAGTVLTAWYDAAHRNHIHFDNGVPFTVIRSGKRSDTTLVQSASNLLNGESLKVDGIWGPLTEAAYDRLRTRLGLGGRDPRGNVAHARELLVHMALRGFAGRPI